MTWKTFVPKYDPVTRPLPRRCTRPKLDDPSEKRALRANKGMVWDFSERHISCCPYTVNNNRPQSPRLYVCSRVRVCVISITTTYSTLTLTLYIYIYISRHQNMYLRWPATQRFRLLRDHCAKHANINTNSWQPPLPDMLQIMFLYHCMYI